MFFHNCNKNPPKQHSVQFSSAQFCSVLDSIWTRPKSTNYRHALLKWGAVTRSPSHDFLEDVPVQVSVRALREKWQRSEIKVSSPSER